MMSPAQQPLGLKLYRSLSRAGRPVANLALSQRLKAGKEDPVRIGERRGETGVSRPDGQLVWIHGASVGESLSVIPLVEHLKKQHPQLNFLITTGTVTSASLIKSRLPDNAIHQFIPLDHPEFVSSFLDHWHPDCGIFIESELWPNLVIAAREKIKKMAIVNGRISPSSFDGWRRQPNMIRYLLSGFDVIIAQDRHNADRLENLSGKHVHTVGNLKNAAAPLETALPEYETLLRQSADRPCWLAASTHIGEDEFILAAHNVLKAEFPDLLTFIAPRHPDRGDEIYQLAGDKALAAVKRSSKLRIDLQTDIYIADTLGELGLFYRRCDIAFVGGSLTDKGGHNPLEPARLGSAILHGPNTFNFAETYELLRNAGGSALVRNERELASAVKRLLSDKKTRIAMTDAARNTAETDKEVVLTNITKLLEDVLPAVEKSAHA